MRIAMLKFQPQAVAENFGKLVGSAVANAETTEGLNGETLVISQVYVDEGPTMKRWRPARQGLGQPHLQAHQPPHHRGDAGCGGARRRPKAEKPAKKTAAKKPAAKKATAKKTEKEN